MSEARGDDSLKGKIRRLSKEHGLKAQEVLQMCLFEHLLMRLARSPYADRFVLKGGLLISSMTGICQRTTMDMDATVVGMDMGEDAVSGAMEEICAVDVGDGMSFALERIEPIRRDDEYANWRAHLRARYGKIDAPVKVDITTGDEIYPSQVRYAFELMFDEGTLEVLSYHPATVLAEKLETMLRRGEANTRGRDLYDLYAIPRFYPKEIDGDDIREALLRTSGRRASRRFLSGWREAVEALRSSEAMHRVWDSYLADNPYAQGVALEDALDSAERILTSTGL